MSEVLRKLQREVFILSLKDPLADVPSLNGFRARLLDEHELEVEKNQQQDLNDLFTQLAARDIHVLSLRNKANRLEELFMNLVESKQGRVAT